MARKNSKGQTEAQKAEAKAEREKEKRNRWLTLAPKRTQKVLKAMANLLNCFGQGYTSTKQERDEIVNAIAEKWQEIADASKGTQKKDVTFKFSMSAS